MKMRRSASWICSCEGMSAQRRPSEPRSLFQIAFPFFVFLNRSTRVLAVLVAMTFHLAIGSVMGLVTFAAFMMAVDLAIIGDDEYRTVGRFSREARDWLVGQTRPLRPFLRPILRKD